MLQNNYPSAPPYSNLFRDGDSAAIARTPIRPLGRFSDFVVEELPVRLKAILEASPEDAERELRRFAQDVDALASNISTDKIVFMDQSRAHVARVDAIYAYNAIVQAVQIKGLATGRMRKDMRGVFRAAAKAIVEKVGSAIERFWTPGGAPAARSFKDSYIAEVVKDFIPPHLQRLVADTSHKTLSPPFLTYQDLILFNLVENDPRLFMRGRAGYAERDFYLGHLYIERLYGNAISSIEAGLGTNDPDKLAEALLQASLPMDYARRVMHHYRAYMQDKEFAEFRVVFGKDPVHGSLGPSGRFSAKVPYLSILLLGRELLAKSPMVFEGLMQYAPLFPRDDMAKVIFQLPSLGCGEAVSAAVANSFAGRKAAGRYTPTKSLYGSVLDFVKKHPDHQGLREAFAVIKKLMDDFTNFHKGAAKKYTIDPQRAVQGATDGRELERALSQRIIMPDGPG